MGGFAAETKQRRPHQDPQLRHDNDVDDDDDDDV